MLPAGLSSATSIRIGQHQGAGRPRVALLVGRLAIGGGALVMLGIALLFWSFPAWLVGLFLPDGHSPVSELARQLVLIAAVFVIFDGTQSIAQGALRGIRQARLGFYGGLLCYCLIGASGAWLLGVRLGIGPHGVWWGLAFGLACAALLLTGAFEWLMRRQLGAGPVQDLSEPLAAPRGLAQDG